MPHHDDRTHDARTLADRLAEVAARLDQASDLDHFIQALDAHCRLWQGIRGAAPSLGPLIPEQLMEFATQAPARRGRRLDDHEVEALIHIDRYVANTLAKACELPAE